MGYTRVSVAALMALVASTGLGFAALRTPSELWADTIFSLLLATLSAGLLAALLLPREDRASWLGFTLFGRGYAVSCFGPWSRTEVAPHLITTELLAFDFNLTDPVRSGPDDANPSARANSSHLRLGQSASDLLIALIGGVVARTLVARHPRGRNRGAEEPGTAPRHRNVEV